MHQGLNLQGRIIGDTVQELHAPFDLSPAGGNARRQHQRLVIMWLLRQILGDRLVCLLPLPEFDIATNVGESGGGFPPVNTQPDAGGENSHG